MEFFGITRYGPQDYIKDMIKPGYKEPKGKKDVSPVMENVLKTSTCPKIFERPDVDVIRTIDIYMGNVNGFAYGSLERFDKMKIKGIVKPLGPPDMYRLPPTTAMEYGWFLCDPPVIKSTWYKSARFPRPWAPNTYILDIERRNNKNASLF